MDIEKIKQLIEQGLSIEDACKSSGINRDTFYKNASWQEREDVKRLRVATKKVNVNITGCPLPYNMRDCDNCDCSD